MASLPPDKQAAGNGNRSPGQQRASARAGVQSRSLLVDGVTAEKHDMAIHGAHRMIREYTTFSTQLIHKQRVSERPIFFADLDRENSQFKTMAANRNEVSYSSLPPHGKIPNFWKDSVSQLDKDIWISTKNSSLSEDHPNRIILEELSKARREAIDNAGIKVSAFAIYVLVQNDKNLKWPWKNNKSFLKMEVETVTKTIDMVITKHKTRLAKIEQILRCGVEETRVKLRIKFQATTSTVRETQSSYHALGEVLQDPHSNFRTQLEYLNRVPSLRVMEIHTGEDDRPLPIADMYLEVELRPAEYQGFEALTASIDSGQTTQLLESTLQSQRMPFEGPIQLILDQSVEKVKRILEKQVIPENPDVTSLKALSVLNLYTSMLDDPKKTPSYFLKILSANGCENLFTEIRDETGKNAMHLAVEARRVDFLQRLFFKNEWGKLRDDVIYRESGNASYFGYTPRRFAEMRSFSTKGQILLDEYDFLDMTYLNMSVLDRACLFGNLEYVKMISKADPRLLIPKETNDPGPLFYACASGSAEVLEYLIEALGMSTGLNGVDAKKQGKFTGWNDRVNAKKQSCLHVAAICGHTHLLGVLHKNRFDIRGNRDMDGHNAIDYCVMNGDLASLCFFKECKFPMEKSLLALAVKYNRPEIFRFLSEECALGVDSAEDKNGRVPIQLAAVQGDLDTVKELLSLGADITHTDTYGKNIFHLLAEIQPSEEKPANTLIPILKSLLDYAKQKDLPLFDLLNARDAFTGQDLLYLVRGKDQGRRAWHWAELRRLHIKRFKDALAEGRIDVDKHGKILFSGFGLSPDSQTNRLIEERQQEALRPENRRADMTPLHFAVNRGHREMVEMLLESGADPNTKDVFGATPLHHAAMSGDHAILHMLTDHGGDTDTLTEDGKTVAQIADDNQHQNILSYLEGSSLLPTIQNFRNDALIRAKDLLCEATMRKKRDEGTDLKRHIIETLRGLTIDVNVMLRELGSGPVQEASHNSDCGVLN